MRELCNRNLSAGLAAPAIAVVIFLAAMACPAGEFGRATVDIGIVVDNLEKSAEFYKSAIGLIEIEGFSVPAEMGLDSGLTDYKAFRVRQFVTDATTQATRIKLMEFPTVGRVTVPHDFIHSAQGYRYLTFHVADMGRAVERLKKVGVKIPAYGPYALPKGFPEGVFLTVVRDPDGNMIELLGPYKEPPKKEPEPKAPYARARWPSLPARTLHFPSEGSLGKLSIADPGSTGPVNWKELGEAKGEVVVPAGKILGLRVSPEAVSRIGALTRLKSDDIQDLSFRQVKITDKDLAAIQHLTGLRRLVLAKTAITDKGVPYLMAMKQLEWLDLSQNRRWITNKAVEKIAVLENLRRLDLAYASISYLALVDLSCLQNLEVLSLNHVRGITDGSLAHLKHLKSLRVLDLSNTRVGDEGMANLTTLPLEELGLRAAHRVTTKSLQSLRQIVTLKTLKVSRRSGLLFEGRRWRGSDSEVKEGKAKLEKALPGVKVVVK